MIYKNQKIMVTEIKEIIDDYYINGNEEKIIKTIKKIKEINKMLLLDEKTSKVLPTVKFRLGKKRMRVLEHYIK